MFFGLWRESERRKEAGATSSPAAAKKARIRRDGNRAEKKPGRGWKAIYRRLVLIFFLCRWEMASLLLCLHSTFVYNSFGYFIIWKSSGSLSLTLEQKQLEPRSVRKLGKMGKRRREISQRFDLTVLSTRYLMPLPTGLPIFLTPRFSSAVAVATVQ